MACSIEEWRKELEAVDLELVRLLNRRAQLALSLLNKLRTERLSLGDVQQDLDRLLIFLSTSPFLTPPPLDERALRRIFRQIISESMRKAASALAPNASESTSSPDGPDSEGRPS